MFKRPDGVRPRSYFFRTVLEGAVAVDCNIPSSNAANQPVVHGLSNSHPGRTNILFTDGSVKFLKDSTASPLICALGSWAAGEIVSADSYRDRCSHHNLLNIII
jgi:prepilin-type processing-associated H-X9-DG protein